MIEAGGRLGELVMVLGFLGFLAVLIGIGSF